jgi:hypothetical protein
MNWKPIYTMPDELRDGRQVLLWPKHADESDGFFVGRFSRCYWVVNGIGYSDECWTHYCEITKPEVRDGE